MEQKIEVAEAFGILVLKDLIQEITSQKNAKGFKLTEIASIETNSPNNYVRAILVFTKE